MTVKKGDYGGRSRRSTGPVMVNLRLVPPAGVKVTKKLLGEVVDSIRDGLVPRGWKFAGVEWRNPAKASAGWKRGELDDLDKFLPILNAISRDKLVDSFRAALVEGGKKPGPKRRAKIEQEREKARAAMDEAHRERAKAVKTRDKRKTAEARRKYERVAEAARLRYVKAAKRAERMTSLLEGARREYELAANYKGKKGGRR